MAEDEWKMLLHQTSQTQQKYASAHHKSLDHAAKLVQEMEIVLSVSSTELVVLAAKKPFLPFPKECSSVHQDYRCHHLLSDEQ